MDTTTTTTTNAKANATTNANANANDNVANMAPLTTAATMAQIKSALPDVFQAMTIEEAFSKSASAIARTNALLRAFIYTAHSGSALPSFKHPAVSRALLNAPAKNALKGKSLQQIVDTVTDVYTPVILAALVGVTKAPVVSSELDRARKYINGLSMATRVALHAEGVI